MAKERDVNSRQIHADPGMAAEQVNFGLDQDPPDPDTKGCIPDPGDGYQGQDIDIQAVGPYRYGEFPADSLPATRFVAPNIHD